MVVPRTLVVGWLVSLQWVNEYKLPLLPFWALINYHYCSWTVFVHVGIFKQRICNLNGSCVAYNQCNPDLPLFTPSQFKARAMVAMVRFFVPGSACFSMHVPQKTGCLPIRPCSSAGIIEDPFAAASPHNHLKVTASIRNQPHTRDEWTLNHSSSLSGRFKGVDEW